MSFNLPGWRQDSVIDRACEWLHQVDQRFSVYRHDSEIRRLESGLLELSEAHPDVRSVLCECESLRDHTDGCFDHRPHAQSRRLDPSALVKGRSIDRLAQDLTLAGVERFCISAGGDVVCAGGCWRVGVRHPERVDAVAAVLHVHTGAVATSGAYERGTHIWGATRSADILSSTVVAPTLGLADALATAAWVSGQRSPDWFGRFENCDLLTMHADQTMRWTNDLSPQLLAPTAPTRK